VIPFITADQLLAHAVGDYLLQSDWMATRKTAESRAALVHALTYSLPFLFLQPSLLAISFIVLTHFVIDRWRLARYLVWAKNWFAPRWVPALELEVPQPFISGRFTAVALESSSFLVRNMPWRLCSGNGYDPARPAWLTTWLLIIADNILHVICNGLALRYL